VSKLASTPIFNHMPHARAVVALLICVSRFASAQTIPKAPGALVDIGGQRLHVNCTGAGSPTVILESGTGDVSVIWALVQPSVAKFARVCSYDRGGYAWSDPGSTPRTFAQLSLELHTALERLRVPPPYVLVGQSYGGLLVRGFAASYPHDVVGMVLVDAVHEDQHSVWGGQPHLLREGARGREPVEPHVALNRALLDAAAAKSPRPVADQIEAPMDRLPSDAQAIWRWAEAQPLLGIAQSAETDWSPEEMVHMRTERQRDRATLGDIPLVVLARTRGGYSDGMSISADSLERERKALQADLARLSRKGRVIYAANAGHNIHVEDPALVVSAIRDVVSAAASRGR